MTKRELVARLTRDPIVVQQVAKVAYYRIALHDDPDQSGGVWLGLAPVTGTLVVEDYAHVHARVNGRVVHLTYRETEAIVSRLRSFFMRGGTPATRRAARGGVAPTPKRGRGSPASARPPGPPLHAQADVMD